MVIYFFKRLVSFHQEAPPVYIHPRDLSRTTELLELILGAKSGSMDLGWARTYL